MQKLVDGIHRFQDGIFSSQERLFKRLVDGQKPLALFITCSDSRIDPAMLTQTKPGELFILRNIGNIVPPYGAATSSGEAAAIEYAIDVLGINDVVVCGHSHCGAMNALLHPEQMASLPAVRAWMSHAEATSRIIREKYDHISENPSRLTATVQENVLVQLGNLRTHPCVLAAMGRKRLKLHGWVYKFETGQVFAYDPEVGQFTSVSSASGQAHRVSADLPAI